MKLLPFQPSPLVSVGVELEFQLVDPRTFNLVNRAKELIRHVQDGPFHAKIKPEITQCMIEINSSIHLSPSELENEFHTLHDYLLETSRQLGFCIAGGGTHPFATGEDEKVFPLSRYKKLLQVYRYLSRRATIFGQHIHIGCTNGQDAIYLTHALSRYIPHFIALSASSPFYQTTDTCYDSARLSIFSGFATSGVIPLFTTWEEFSDYYYKMKRLKIIESMKDFYWDVRPKPEFGTVEIRICDTPLTVNKAVAIAAYAQALAKYILQERPLVIEAGLYDVYSFNRFQASRYGFAGEFIHPQSLQHNTIQHDMERTFAVIEKYAEQLGTSNYLASIQASLQAGQNDATLLRTWYAKTHKFKEVMREQCQRWSSNESKENL